MNVVEARELWNAFGATTALRDARLSVAAGSIHALVGENGAGKSTLIKILTGVHRADRGSVQVAGKPRSFANPQEAIRAGISVVHQERNLVPAFSVAENLYLHDPPTRRGFLQYDRMFASARERLRRVGLDVDPRTRAEALSAAQRQLVEIARALALRAKVLFLDEPTASITDREAQALFGILRGLRDEGGAVLFVSHRLEEVFSLCDRITVIRDGQTILDDAPRAELTQADVVSAMVGRSIVPAGRQTRAPGQERAPALELRSVRTRFGHRDIDLALKPGRVVGLYGLVGAGRTELARAILGLDEIEAGELRVRGEVARIRNPHEALHGFGVGYVSEDRKGEGLILPHTISHNVGITIWDRLAGLLGSITQEREKRSVAPVVERMGVRLARLDQSVGELSGGNQQKVSVAKWLACDADVLIVDEPTIGVDVRTKEDMYRLIEELARRGKAILVISSDLAEIVRLSDDVLVMAKKRLVAEFANTGDYASLSERVMSAIIASNPASSAAAENV